MYVVFLYLGVIFLILFFVKESDSYIEILIIVMLFLVVPPFILFMIKFGIIFSLESFVKVAFFFSVFDVIILFYYFSLIFMKFMLMDLGIFVYIMNFLVLFFIIIFRSCVTMIVFD